MRAVLDLSRGGRRRLVAPDRRLGTLLQLRGVCGTLLMLASMAAFWAPAAPAESSTALRNVGASTAAFAADGSRYAAWQKPGRAVVVVFDARTSRKRQVAVPLGCRLVSDEEEVTEEVVARAHSGRFLLTCGAGREVLDAENGVRQLLPALPGGYQWEEAGSRYAAGPASECAFKRCISVVDLATNRVSVRHESAIPELDRPGAPSVQVCRALQQRVATDLVTPRASFAYASGLLVHAAKRRGYIEIDRCKGAPTLIPGRGYPRDFDVRDGLSTWDTGYGPSAEPEESESPSVLGAYSLSSGRLRTWRLPRLSVAEEPPGLRTLGYSEHVGRTVFWIATRAVRLGKAGNAPEGSSVYSARY